MKVIESSHYFGLRLEVEMLPLPIRRTHNTVQISTKDINDANLLEVETA